MNCARVGPDAFGTTSFFRKKKKVSDIFAGPTTGLWGAIVDN
jgi:hypothetical protein